MARAREPVHVTRRVMPPVHPPECPRVNEAMRPVRREVAAYDRERNARPERKGGRAKRGDERDVRQDDAGNGAAGNVQEQDHDERGDVSEHHLAIGDPVSGEFSFEDREGGAEAQADEHLAHDT